MGFPYENKKEVQKVWKISNRGRILTLRLRDSLEDRLRTGSETEVEETVSEVEASVFYKGVFCTATIMCSDDINFIMNGRIYHAFQRKRWNEGMVEEFVIESPEGKKYPLYYDFTYECNKPHAWRRIHGHGESKSTIENFREAILDAFGIKFDKVIRRE